MLYLIGLVVLSWLSLFDGYAFADTGNVDPAFLALIVRCAPTVHPETMAAVISAESRGHQFAIADAGPVNLPWSRRKALVRSFYPKTLDAAVSLANGLIAKGHTVSLGPAQVNDRNLPKYGLSVKAVFDTCTNVAVGGDILTRFYADAVKKYGAGQRALRASLSAYNSGSWVRGEDDGYVHLVYNQIGKPLTLNSTPRVVLATHRVAAGRSFVMSASSFVAANDW
jgi:type IV secretion system protein VirB1